MAKNVSSMSTGRLDAGQTRNQSMVTGLVAMADADVRRIEKMKQGESVNEERPFDVQVSEIMEFHDHPFHVADDNSMKTLVASIREKGIAVPVLLRPLTDEMKEQYKQAIPSLSDKDLSPYKFEMISGHRRLHAAKILGLKEIPADVRQLSDDDAVIFMVDSNIQRDDILPSERAFSLKMKRDALAHQGKMFTDDAGTSGTKFQKSTTDELGEQFGMSGRYVRKYIQLTNLNKRILDRVDAKKVPMNLGVQIASLDKDIQSYVADYMDEHFVGRAQIENLFEELKDSDGGTLSKNDVFSILSVRRSENASGKISFTRKTLDKYFPETMAPYEREKIIVSLLEQWKNGQE